MPTRASSGKTHLISAKSLRKISSNALEKVVGDKPSLVIYILKCLVLLGILGIVIAMLLMLIPTRDWTYKTLLLARTIDENTDDPGTDPDCDDFDQCTKDECHFGRCQSFRFKNGVPCNTTCFEGETTCQNGQCVGGCPGTCVNAGNCPDIAKAGGGNLDKECDNQKCIWTITDIPPVLQGTCSHGNHGEDALFSDKCRSCIANNEPLRN